jgi:hypothetical protein
MINRTYNFLTTSMFGTSTHIRLLAKEAEIGHGFKWRPLIVIHVRKPKMLMGALVLLQPRWLEIEIGWPNKPTMLKEFGTAIKGLFY